VTEKHLASVTAVEGRLRNQAIRFTTKIRRNKGEGLICPEVVRGGIENLPILVSSDACNYIRPL